MNPRRICAPLCLKAKIHGRAGTWGIEFSASGSLARSGARCARGGVRFEGSCRMGKLLGCILDLPLRSDLILPLTALASAWGKFWELQMDACIV